MLKRHEFGAICAFAAALSFAPSVRALTSGPTQPDFRSWAPSDNRELVDLFTGDFQYSIPLIDIPGPNGSFPLALSYRSGIGVDQEASWVGLGWSLNAGSITRQLRGLPDDFGGGNDHVKNTYRLIPSATIGVGADLDFKIFGGSPLKGIAVGIQRYYNTERGFGWATTVGIKGQYSFSEGQQRALSGGLSVTYNSQQGTSANVSGSLAFSDRFNAGISADISAMEGLHSLGLSSSYHKEPKEGYNRQTMRWKVSEHGSSGRNNYGVNFAGYASPGYVPDAPYDTEGVNLDFSVATGPEAQGAYPNMRFSGFASGQRLKHSTVNAEAFGYYYTELAGADDLMDFHREKDGPVWDKSPVLPTPILTNDLYNITGGKIGGVFRAYRNDIPFLWDKRHSTKADGHTIGLDLGAGGIVRYGIGGTRSQIRTEVGPWDDFNELRDKVSATLAFEPNAERVYFQFIGEATANGKRFEGRLGDDAPIRVALSEQWTSNPSLNISATSPPDLDGLIPYRTAQADASLWRSSNYSIAVPSPDATSLATGSHPLSGYVDNQRFRNPRGAVIQALTNEQILQFGPALEGLIASTPELNSRRQAHPKHFGAFIVTEPDGTRYVYGLTVYNLTQKEVTFNADAATKSVSDTAGNICAVRSQGYDQIVLDSDEYLHIKEVSPYVQTYLLTAVLGPDYSDVDTVPGPSDADLGFWVKFTYEAGETYRWRAPFAGANFIKGTERTRDDKATFTVGTKETWNLRRIETRTHQAEFELASRDDARGAAAEVQDSPTLGASVKRLKSITLNAKTADTIRILKKVLLNHDYSLTPHTPNSSAGKLTLTSVAIHELDSTRGGLSPYTFRYSANNPPYGTYAQDWWGAFTGRDDCSGFPYTSKNNGDAENHADAWTLTAITEPNGGRVAVEYEKDGYAFVQDRPAMKLHQFQAVDQKPAVNRRIYIKPDVLPEGTTDAERGASFAAAHLGGGVGQQVYFRIRSRIRTSPAYYASIGGYATVVAVGFCSACPYGVMASGWIELANVDGMHPFDVAAKEYLRLQEPDKLHSDAARISINPHGSPSDFAMAGLTLAADLALNAAGNPAVDAAIDAINNTAGDQVVAADSWLRLRVPSAKVGGDSRVRTITVNDAWCESTGIVSECAGLQQGTSETTSTYGWIYEYAMEDHRSSGVAVNEPGIGGEENPLRQAESFMDEHWFRTDHNLFYEQPMNLGYFPAPGVGYRRVVKSSILAKNIEAQIAAAKSDAERDLIARPTLAGPVVHEFHTAKDFPTKPDRTNAQRKGDFAPIPIPFVGMVTLQTKSWSQGQSIVTNDMHGKPKRTSSYDLPRDLKPVWDAPVRSEEYRYQDSVQVIDTTTNLDIQSLGSDERRLGRTEEMFVDMRKHRTTAQSIGIDPGVDTIIAVFPLPIPIPWLSVSYSVQEVKLAVVNKVIHKSHVLVATEGHDRGSVFRRENRYFDAISGKPVVRTDDNNFGDPVYEFLIPAYWMYPDLGPAYRSSDSFSAPLSMSDPARREVGLSRAEVPNYTMRGIGQGTEVLASNNSAAAPWADRLVVVRNDGQTLWLRASKVIPAGCTACPGSNPVVQFRLTVLRSSRNALESEAGKILSLKDPLDYERVVCLIPREGECKSKEDNSSKSALVVPAGQLAETINNALSGAAATPMEHQSKSFRRLDVSFTKSGISLHPPRERNTSCSISFRSAKGDAIRAQDVRRLRSISAPRRAAAKTHVTQYGATLQLVNREQSAVASIETDCTASALSLPAKTGTKTCTNYVAENYAVLDQVLDASASDFGQAAELTNLEDYRSSDTGAPSYEALVQASPYELGLAGLLRPVRRVSYFEQRIASSPPNLRRDGTFDGVAMYDWGLSPSDTCVDRSKWRRMLELTRYSPYGHGLEERNALGVHSTALYGYLSTIPIAVAHNARNDEIGFEGFEEFGRVGETTFKSGNIQFFDKADETPGKRYISHFFDAELTRDLIRLIPSAAEAQEAQDLNNARSSAAQARKVARTPRMESVKPRDIGARFAVARGSPKDPTPGKTYFIAAANCPNNIIGPLGAKFDLTEAPFDPTSGTFTIGDRIPQEPNDGPVRPAFESWRECFGKVQIDIPDSGIVRPGPKFSVAVTASKAHSGKRSLKVERTSRFEQDALVLAPGKKYLLTVWVSRDDTDAPSIVAATSPDMYFPDVRVIDKATNSVLGAGTPPLGPVIEGWQKIEREFVATSDRVFLEFASDTDGAAKPRAAYFDDIRVQPVAAQMKSFVYDNETRALSAILDENHFATFFHYDGAGDLYLINRETVAGIFSVQEGRSHLRER